LIRCPIAAFAAFPPATVAEMHGRRQWNRTILLCECNTRQQPQAKTAKRLKRRQMLAIFASRNRERVSDWGTDLIAVGFTGPWGNEARLFRRWGSS
jgi:hypothetical protein